MATNRERLMNCLPEWHEEAFLIAFMAGLKEEIAGEIRLTEASINGDKCGFDRCTLSKQ